MSFSEFLLQQFLRWQAQEGERKSLSDFGEFLGFAQTTLSNWMNGERSPRRDEGTVLKLAVKLGIETYDALDLPRPDADWFYLQQHWEDATPESRRRAREAIENGITKAECKRIGRSPSP